MTIESETDGLSEEYLSFINRFNIFLGLSGDGRTGTVLMAGNKNIARAPDNALQVHKGVEREFSAYGSPVSPASLRLRGTAYGINPGKGILFPKLMIEFVDPSCNDNGNITPSPLVLPSQVTYEFPIGKEYFRFETSRDINLSQSYILFGVAPVINDEGMLRIIPCVIFARLYIWEWDRKV